VQIILANSLHGDAENARHENAGMEKAGKEKYGKPYVK